MIKRALLLLAITLPLLLSAQTSVGGWRFHPSFVGADASSLIDANDYVYYLSNSCLFRFDKSTSENENLNKVNDLSDMTVSHIYYNYDKEYLVVVYQNSNIDVILSSGSVINMPEIKDAVVTYSKTINDVTFADGLIYVATDFGYVVIDDEKFVVKESRIWDQAFSSVAQVGDLLLISKDTEIYYGKADTHYEQLREMDVDNSTNDNGKIRPISNKSFLLLTGWTFLLTIDGDYNQSNITFSKKVISEQQTSDVQHTQAGLILNTTTKQSYYTMDSNGGNVKQVTCNELVSSHPSSGTTIWALGNQGLHIMGNDNYYKPTALSFSNPFWMTYNQSLDLLYVSSTATNHFFSSNAATKVNTYDGSWWQDVTPDSMPSNGSYWIDFMPDDPNTYFLGGWTSGLHKITNNKRVLTYNASNSPMLKLGGAMHPVTHIDRSGNVWVVQPYENPEHPVMVLPAAKAKLSQVSASDWVLPNVPALYTGKTKRAQFLITQQTSDIKIFTDGDYGAVTFWGSDNALSTSPTQKSYSSFTDQDGNPYNWTYILCLTEDLNGNVWMGSTSGVVSFDPATALQSNFRINHIKVPRNDGTGLADYLMEGIQVNCVAVDGANRKWIGTQSSGLFLVSSDGTEIISQFNSSNSALGSNTIYQVCCDPNSNSVFVTTPEGLYEYFSNSTPAQNNYSNVYAFPNPVRPEYTGQVTITGLMDNSLIKIADASGNVIKQLKSTGGMTSWDGYDQNGERVKSGVYFILASQANGGGEAVVSKVVIIR